MTIKVLVVDDSAVMRSLLSEIIGSAKDLKVVGTASDPLMARELIKQLNPDVVTLDVEMPKMDGLEFLERLMRLRPTPVIMISGLTEKGSEVTFKALEIGAVDFVTKPKQDAVNGIRPYADEICDKIRAAHHARVKQPSRFSSTASKPVSEGALLHGVDTRTQAERLVLIGASTGGTEAIKEVLCGLPAEMPPVMIVQHMPEMFTGSFARRLDSLCALRVKEAEDGEKLLPGHAYIAPGHSHLSLRRTGGVNYCELQRSEPVNRHRPSVDVLFHSAAKLVAPQVVAALLTGMGKDGAQGMLALHKAGAWTIGQDQASCVVYGMPREAALIGALNEVATLKDVAPQIVARLRQPVSR